MYFTLICVSEGCQRGWGSPRRESALCPQASSLGQQQQGWVPAALHQFAVISLCPHPASGKLTAVEEPERGFCFGEGKVAAAVRTAGDAVGQCRPRFVCAQARHRHGWRGSGRKARLSRELARQQRTKRTEEMFYVQRPTVRRWIQKTISAQNEGGGSCLWLRFVLLAAVANEGCQYPEQPPASSLREAKSQQGPFGLPGGHQALYPWQKAEATYLRLLAPRFTLPSPLSNSNGASSTGARGPPSKKALEQCLSPIVFCFCSLQMSRTGRAPFPPVCSASCCAGVLAARVIYEGNVPSWERCTRCLP